MNNDDQLLVREATAYISAEIEGWIKDAKEPVATIDALEAKLTESIREIRAYHKIQEALKGQ